MSFDPSTLVYWRRRIAASSHPDRVFDAVAAVIAETGILAGRRKRCVDSTVFDDAVATQDTVTQLVAAMRKVARVVDGAAEVIAAVCKLDYSRPGKPGIDWDDPRGTLDKVREEIDEVDEVFDDPEHVSGEIGDLLFAVANLARHRHVDPEVALRQAAAKFRRRVQHLESLAAERGIDTRTSGLATVDDLWNEVKAAEH